MTDPTLRQWLAAISQNLTASFIGVLLGLAFAFFVREYWDRWRYGGWHVLVIKNGEEKVNRAISVRKAKDILREAADLSVFLKGVASPYGWITCDMTEKGKDCGLYNKDDARRRIVIDLDCNPKPPRQTSTADLLDVLKQMANQLDLAITLPAPADGQPAHEGA